MSFFTKKNFLYKLIICLCIVLVLINFAGTLNVYAAEDDGSGIGGILLSPICDLLAGLGDGVMNIIQQSIMGTKAIIAVDNSDPSWWESLLKATIALIAVALVVVVAIYFPGVLVYALESVGVAAVKAAIAFGAAGLVFGYGNAANRISIINRSGWRCS